MTCVVNLLDSPVIMWGNHFSRGIQVYFSGAVAYILVY